MRPEKVWTQKRFISQVSVYTVAFAGAYYRLFQRKFLNHTKKNWPLGVHTSLLQAQFWLQIKYTSQS